MISSQATLWLICALNNPHNHTPGESSNNILCAMPDLTSKRYMGPSPPPGKSCHEKKKTFQDYYQVLWILKTFSLLEEDSWTLILRRFFFWL